MEEPTLRENPAGLGEVAARSPVTIATGEGLFSRSEFKQLLDVKGAAIIQPDVMHAAGVTELRKIANMASMSTMSVCRNFVIHECEGADNDLFGEMTEGTYPTQKDGRVFQNCLEFERKASGRASFSVRNEVAGARVTG